MTSYQFVTVSMSGTCSAQGVNEHLSSYDGPAEFLARHGAEIVPGSLVVDLRPLADRDDAVQLAVRAPMVDVRLGEGDISRVADLLAGFEPMGSFMLGLFGWGAGAAPVDGVAGPLDYVSPRDSARYWLAAGAVVGVWDGHQLRAGRELVMGDV